jgi:hypothetical protein
MTDLSVDSSSGDVNRLGEVLAQIAALTEEADKLKAVLKAQAELLGDKVTFEGGEYRATVTTRQVKKTDWHGIVFKLKVPQKMVDEHTTLSKMLVCSVNKNVKTNA